MKSTLTSSWQPGRYSYTMVVPESSPTTNMLSLLLSIIEYNFTFAIISRWLKKQNK